MTTAQSTARGRARIALAAALLNTPDWLTTAAPPAAKDYALQEAQEAAWLPEQLAFVVGSRSAIESAAGGNGSWTVGVKYGALVQHSAMAGQIKALYKKAGLSLSADERRLTNHADIRPDRAALKRLTRTSTVSGHLDVPELTLHTISDQLAPVSYENYYRGLVDTPAVEPCSGRATFRPSGTATSRPRNWSPASTPCNDGSRPGTGDAPPPRRTSTQRPPPPATGPARSSPTARRRSSMPATTPAERVRPAPTRTALPVTSRVRRSSARPGRAGDRNEESDDTRERNHLFEPITSAACCVRRTSCRPGPIAPPAPFPPSNCGRSRTPPSSTWSRCRRTSACNPPPTASSGARPGTWTSSTNCAGYIAPTARSRSISATRPATSTFVPPLSPSTTRFSWTTRSSPMTSPS